MAASFMLLLACLTVVCIFEVLCAQSNDSVSKLCIPDPEVCMNAVGAQVY